MCLIIFQRYDPAVGEWMGLKRPVERVRRKGDGLRWLEAWALRWLARLAVEASLDSGWKPILGSGYRG